MEQMINAAIPWAGNSSVQDDPFTDLASAIVAQAAKDYIKTLRRLWKKDTDVQAKRKLLLVKFELETFFHSAWYEMLTDLDPECLLARCSKTAFEQEKEYRRKAALRQNRKHVDTQNKNTEEQEDNVHEKGQSIT